MSGDKKICQTCLQYLLNSNDFCCKNCIREYESLPDLYMNASDAFETGDHVVNYANLWPDNFYREIRGISASDYQARPKVIAKRIDAVLEELSDRERAVIEQRYRKGLTLQEIGKNIGVSAERVRQIIAKVQRKLRQSGRLLLFFKGK